MPAASGPRGCLRGQDRVQRQPWESGRGPEQEPGIRPGGERGSWGRLAEAGRWLLPVPRPLQEKRRGTGQRVKGPVSLDVYCAHLLLILQKSNN